MIIDAHNHPGWYGYNLAKFLANMDANGIDLTWLQSWECPTGEWDPSDTAILPEPREGGPIPFGLCVDFAEGAPGRFVLGFAPDPRRADALDSLKAARATWGYASAVN